MMKQITRELRLGDREEYNVRLGNDGTILMLCDHALKPHWNAFVDALQLRTTLRGTFSVIYNIRLPQYDNGAFRYRLVNSLKMKEFNSLRLNGMVSSTLVIGLILQQDL